MGVNKVYFLLAKNPAWWAIGARIIEKIEGIEFSHSAVMIDNVVYESVWPKSRKMNFLEWSNHYKAKFIFGFDTTEENIELVKMDCEEQMGKEYSIIQLIAIWLGIVFPFFNSWLEKRRWNGQKYLICTELCSDIAFNHFEVGFTQELDNVDLTELKSALEKKVKW